MRLGQTENPLWSSTLPFSEEDYPSKGLEPGVQVLSDRPIDLWPSTGFDFLRMEEKRVGSPHTASPENSLCK